MSTATSKPVLSDFLQHREFTTADRTAAQPPVVRDVHATPMPARVKRPESLRMLLLRVSGKMNEKRHYAYADFVHSKHRGRDKRVKSIDGQNQRANSAVPLTRTVCSLLGLLADSLSDLAAVLQHFQVVLTQSELSELFLAFPDETDPGCCDLRALAAAFFTREEPQSFFREDEIAAKKRRQARAKQEAELASQREFEAHEAAKAAATSNDLPAAPQPPQDVHSNILGAADAAMTARRTGSGKRRNELGSSVSGATAAAAVSGWQTDRRPINELHTARRPQTLLAKAGGNSLRQGAISGSQSSRRPMPHYMQPSARSARPDPQPGSLSSRTKETNPNASLPRIDFVNLARHADYRFERAPQSSREPPKPYVHSAR
jgi:hypothetical protein